ncbi:MAG: hypothetical protein KF830_07485 [Planctomycetes bacterium]|nr:hypothetical protein [Planctomycetota bacterium]
MPRRPVPLLAFAAALLAACGSTPSPPRPAPTPDPPAAAAAAAAPTWVEAMREVERRYTTLETALARPVLGDLRAAAAAADEAAARMRLGYGPHEDPTVPGFARMARDAEAWLLEIALEARQAHGDIARDLFLGQRRRHCGDCHDAHDRVHG